MANPIAILDWPSFFYFNKAVIGLATGIATFDDLMTGLKKKKDVTNNLVQLGAGVQGQQIGRAHV